MTAHPPETSAALKPVAAEIFKAGLKAVDPDVCINRSLRIDGDRLHIGGTSFALSRIGRLYVIGIGKASAAMARAAEAILGDRIDHGLVITKDAHALPLSHCRVHEAAHPVPDARGVAATSELLDLVATAGPDDLLLCLISGGGSALSPAPVEGLGLADKQATTRRLLSCGATIHEINTVRKHLSRIKGGQLCRHANGAAVAALILSDVIGDDLDIIASGITAPDPSTFADSLAIIDRYGLREEIPPDVVTVLSDGAAGKRPETPKPDDPLFDRVANHIVGSVSDALAAAEAEARRRGLNPLVLASTIQGEAAEVAKVLSAVAQEVRRSGRPVPPPACLLAGGETTVTLKGSGLGGRNMELALSAALALDGTEGILLLSAGTDGTDGPTDAAGAVADGTTVRRAQALGRDAAADLADNDSYRFFEPLGDLFVTGPTRTNVMDLQVVVVERPHARTPPLRKG